MVAFFLTSALGHPEYFPNDSIGQLNDRFDTIRCLVSFFQ